MNVRFICIFNIYKLFLYNIDTTPQEQEILSKYVGWGGLPQAFDEKDSSSWIYIYDCIVTNYNR